MRNRFSPGCTMWICSPGAAVGAGVGAGVEIGVGVRATVGVVSAAVEGVGVAASGLDVGVASGVPSEVGLGEAAAISVPPAGVVAVTVGVTCTSETTAGLARLQLAVRATRSKAKATTASVFFFMVASFGKSNGD